MRVTRFFASMTVQPKARHLLLAIGFCLAAPLPSQATETTAPTAVAHTTFTQTTATSPATSTSASAPKTPTAMPISIHFRDYRLRVQRVVSGVPARLTNDDGATLREKDFIQGPLELPKQPAHAYTGIVYELESPAKPGEGGLLAGLLSDGYRSVAARWDAWATVKDSRESTLTAGFSGNRRGWGKIAYMDTPLNLPADDEPYLFELYFTRKADSAVTVQDDSTIEITGLRVPDQGSSMDPLTTTIQGIPLTIHMAGKMTDVPAQFSAGQFSGPSVMVSSPKPIPGIQISVRDGEGNSETNEWRFPTTDDIHHALMSFGGNQEPKDPFQPGTPVTITITRPETLQFKFSAIPERPTAAPQNQRPFQRLAPGVLSLDRLLFNRKAEPATAASIALETA